MINGRGTNYLPLIEFADKLSQCTNNEITLLEAAALGKECDVLRKGRVSHTDIEYLISRQNGSNGASVEDLISDHAIFPEWLTKRSDFQQYYEELKGENGIPPNYVMEQILRTALNERKF